MPSIKGFGFINKYTPKCSECKLYKDVKNPRLPYSGEGRSKTLIISDRPSKVDDLDKEHLVGTTGESFAKFLKNYSFDLYKDFWLISAVNCHTKKNITRKQEQCCWPLIKKAIDTCQPNHIWLLGEEAVDTFYHTIFEYDVGLTRFRGYCIPDVNTKAWVWSFSHPRDPLVKQTKDKSLIKTFERDIERALDHIHDDKPVFTDDHIKNVNVITDYNTIMEELEKINSQAKYMCYDYETSSLKPYYLKPYIYTISARSFTDFDKKSDLGTISFPLEFPKALKSKEKTNVTKLWKNILKKKSIKKIAHHLKFEDTWSSYCFNIEVKGWFWCTKYTAHLIDERKHIDDLTFQAALLGIPPYDTEMNKYKKSDTTNGYNKLHKAPLFDLLLYGGTDSYVTGELFFKQRPLIKKETSQQQIFKLFREGAIAFSKAEQLGFPADKNYYLKKDKQLGKKIDKLHSELVNDKIIKKDLSKHYKEININSPDQLGTLIYDIIGTKSKKLTKGGKQATDIEVLQEIDHPWIKKLVDYKKYDKIKNTFIHSLLPEIDSNDLLHTFYHLHTTRTGRSSSSNPNWHNQPKRDEEAKDIIRSGIKPAEDEKIGEADYGALEVNIIACASKDPTLIKYCSDDNSDPHRDTSADLFLLNPNDIPKKVRFFVKNGYVFPEFYGSYYANCAENLWYNTKDLTLNDGMPVHDYLREQGITCLRKKTDKKGYASKGTFEYHVRECEQVFWERFPVVKEWQQELTNFYYKYGYVENLFGFRRRGYISKNQIINTPIQGCLQRNSLVQTKMGWIPIQKLVGKKVEVWTGFNWANAVGLNRGKCKLVHIQLESGITIRCDIRHELKTIGNKWKKFKDLEVGEYVALPKINIEKRINNNTDIDWFFILGFIIGDGHYYTRITDYNKTRYCLCICGGETKYDVLQTIACFLKDQGYRPKITKKDNKYMLNIWQNKIYNELTKKLKLDPNKNAHTKRIPKSVWEASYKEQMNFFDGLTLADGSRADWSLHMCNKRLLKEVQILTYGLNYDSTFATTTDGYKLTFRQINSEKNIRRYPYEDVEIFMKGKKYKSAKDNSIKIANKRSLTHKKFNQSTAERLIKEVKPMYEIYRYDKITNIKVLTVKDDTFTMSVDDPKHQFVADGVIHKNTAFQLLLWSYIQTTIHCERNKTLSKIRGQIHDSILFTTYKIEEQKFLQTLKTTMIDKATETFDWIIVPLQVEIEISKLGSEGGNWAELEEVQV